MLCFSHSEPFLYNFPPLLRKMWMFQEILPCFHCHCPSTCLYKKALVKCCQLQQQSQSMASVCSVFVFASCLATTLTTYMASVFPFKHSIIFDLCSAPIEDMVFWGIKGKWYICLWYFHESLFLITAVSHQTYPRRSGNQVRCLFHEQLVPQPLP